MEQHEEVFSINSITNKEVIALLYNYEQKRNIISPNDRKIAIEENFRDVLSVVSDAQKKDLINLIKTNSPLLQSTKEFYYVCFAVWSGIPKTVRFV